MHIPDEEEDYSAIAAEEGSAWGGLSGREGTGIEIEIDRCCDEEGCGG